MSIKERGKALEDAFFAKRDKELLEKVKADLDITSKREELKSATGIDDDGVLDELIAIGVTTKSLAAMSLIPLVLVAWADGNAIGGERKAILQSAEQSGVRPGSATSDVLEGWLAKEPDAVLTEAWQDYIRVVMEKLPVGEKIKLGEQLHARCKEVAEAAGGFLGLASISSSEMEVLEMIQATLEKGTSQ